MVIEVFFEIFACINNFSVYYGSICCFFVFGIVEILLWIKYKGKETP